MILGNIKFEMAQGLKIAKYAHCLETGKFYDFKTANKYLRLYQQGV